MGGGGAAPAARDTDPKGGRRVLGPGRIVTDGVVA
jgi:hypothetical protein